MQARCSLTCPRRPASHPIRMATTIVAACPMKATLASDEDAPAIATGTDAMAPTRSKPSAMRPVLRCERSDTAAVNAALPATMPKQHARMWVRKGTGTVDIDVSRNVGSDTVPSPSPSEVTTNNATAHVMREYAIPETDGLAPVAKLGLLSSKVGRVVLTVLCLSPLLVASYYNTLSYAPMKGEEGTWSSDVWQRDIPSGFRTKLRDGTLAFYATDGATDHCEYPIGSAPGLSDGPSSAKQGWIRAQGPQMKMVAWRDGGLLAISYDQDDPWVFFTRGAPPKRTATVRYHLVDTRTCVD